MHRFWQPFLIVAMLALTACHESGTWVDDPRNFERFFATRKPNDVTVAHSRYWRSPHFTFEYDAYLQIRSNANFQKLILSQPLKKVTDTNTVQYLRGATSKSIDWFAPKPLDRYDIWTSTNYPERSAFCILIDRETGDMFFTDRQ